MIKLLIFITPVIYKNFLINKKIKEYNFMRSMLYAITLQEINSGSYKKNVISHERILHQCETYSRSVDRLKKLLR